MTKKLYIKTYGCQMNVYDSTRMGDVLAPYGYRETDSPEGADMVILNTCHIREKAAEKMYSDLGRLRMEKVAQAEAGKKMLIAVAGCVAQAEGAEIITRMPYVDMVVGPQSYHTLPDLIAKTEREQQSITKLDFIEEKKFDLLPETYRTQGASAFVSIQEGCDKFCTFCVVPYTRGAEFSRPLAAILHEVKTHLAHGAIDIVLLGQNVNAYHGRLNTDLASPLAGEAMRLSADALSRSGEGIHRVADSLGAPPPQPSPARGEGEVNHSLAIEHKEIGLAELLHHVAALPGIQRLRYTTSHPRDMDEALIAAHGEIEVLMPVLHLPVQSGSDTILKAMNRKHTAADYIAITEKLRAARSDIAFTSDFIVGFPGETEADFEQTLALVETVGFAAAYAYKYSPRPGTPAANIAAQVDEATMDARLQRLIEAIGRTQLRFNESKLGTVQPVLVERPGKRPGQMIGKTPYMQSVVLENAVYTPGQRVDVRITHAYGLSLMGEVTKASAA